MTVILIVIGALGTVPKGLERGQENLEIRDHPDHFPDKLHRIPIRVLETWENLQSPRLQWKASS